jgi:DICT domain-containing protein
MMNRRRFVQAGMSTLLVPGAMPAVAVDAPGQAGPAWDYFFFDERFLQARRLAEALSGATDPTPVVGDVTGIWTGELGRASLMAPLAMQGITTESFHFCLKVLLAEQARVETQVSRIDRDLHFWTMRTSNHSRRGTVS